MTSPSSAPQQGLPGESPADALTDDGKLAKASPTILPPRKTLPADSPALHSERKQIGLQIEAAPPTSQPASEQEMFWFHCGRCGSMFQAKAGEQRKRLCTQCGLSPSTGLYDRPSTLITNASPLVPTTDPEVPPSKHSNNRGPRETKSSHIMLKLVCGWLLLVVLIVVGARWIWHEDEMAPQSPNDPAKTASTSEENDPALLQSEIRACISNFSEFISSDSPEARNQSVFSPISTAYRIARFYSLNPAPKIDLLKLDLVEKSVIHLPGSKSIATRWKYQDDQLIEAVFHKENDEWRLDWDQFVCYGDYPWSLFLAGGGPSEGEFRLLARERLAETRKNEDSISIVCYAPKFGYPQKSGIQSPEFLVSRKTRNGQLLDAAFKLERSGKQVFDSHLSKCDPDGTIRLRVKVRRIKTDELRTFEITNVSACHWYSTDDPGVEPLKSNAR